jgi:hypothetical protein
VALTSLAANFSNTPGMSSFVSPFRASIKTGRPFKRASGGPATPSQSNFFPIVAGLDVVINRYLQTCTSSVQRLTWAQKLGFCYEFPGYKLEGQWIGAFDQFVCWSTQPKM